MSYSIRREFPDDAKDGMRRRVAHAAAWNIELHSHVGTIRDRTYRREYRLVQVGFLERIVSEIPNAPSEFSPA